MTQLRELEGLGGGAAAGAPGDGYKERSEGARHAVETRAEVGGAHAGFGGEEFEGEVGGAGGEGGDFGGYFFHGEGVGLGGQSGGGGWLYVAQYGAVVVWRLCLWLYEELSLCSWREW